MLHRFSKLLTSATAFVLLISAATPSSLPSEFTTARKLYYAGSDGDKKAYDEADKLFDKLHAQDAHAPLIEAYYGSLRLLEASRTWAIWRKNSLSKQGIGEMDSAVQSAPGNLEVRFVRAVTTYRLPSFFGRKEQSKQDFQYLAGRAVTAAHSGQLEPRLAAASLYYHGQFLKENNKLQAAIASWNQAVALAPQSRAAQESREALAKVSGS